MAEEPEQAPQAESAHRPGAVISPGPTPPVPPEPPVPATPPEQTDAPASESLPEEPDQTGTITWSAPEFVAHDKSASWYLGLAVVAVMIAVLTFLITKDAVSVAVIIVVAVILGVYGRHQPRQLSYRLSSSGIDIGAKYHSYEEFKSFSVKPEGNLLNLSFMPLKRFAPLTTIYYPPEEEEKIMAVLSARMPYEEPRRDAVDSLMRRIRF